MTNFAGYDVAIETARELLEPHDENRGSEYAQGQINLIASLWGKHEMDTSTRMDEVECDIFGPYVEWDITVVNENGNDITESLAKHESIDGNRRAHPTASLGSAGAIGRLDDLTTAEAGVCLSQILDQGHEWGKDSDAAEALHSLIEAGIAAKTTFSFVVPDGWTVTAIRKNDASTELISNE